MKTISKKGKGDTRYVTAGVFLGRDGSICVTHYGEPEFFLHIRKGSKQFDRWVRDLKKTSTKKRIAMFEATQ